MSLYSSLIGSVSQRDDQIFNNEANSTNCEVSRDTGHRATRNSCGIWSGPCGIDSAGYGAYRASSFQSPGLRAARGRAGRRGGVITDLERWDGNPVNRSLRAGVRGGGQGGQGAQSMEATKTGKGDKLWMEGAGHGGRGGGWGASTRGDGSEGGVGGRGRRRRGKRI